MPAGSRGRGKLNFASARRLRPSHPDRAPCTRIRDIQLDKANPIPEADRTGVCSVHSDMHGADPLGGRHGKPGSKHPGPDPASLKAGQQIHMKMGRTGLDHSRRYRLRLVYREDAPLIVRPFGHPCLIRRGILLTQPWPPLPLESSFPIKRISAAGPEEHKALSIALTRRMLLQGQRYPLQGGVPVLHVGNLLFANLDHCPPGPPSARMHACLAKKPADHS